MIDRCRCCCCCSCCQRFRWILMIRHSVNDNRRDYRLPQQSHSKGGPDTGDVVATSPRPGCRLSRAQCNIVTLACLPNDATRCLFLSQVLHAHYLVALLHEVRRVLKTFPNVRHASTLTAQRITVCGDLHGKLHDLLLIFWKVSLLCKFYSYVARVRLPRSRSRDPRK